MTTSRTAQARAAGGTSAQSGAQSGGEAYGAARDAAVGSRLDPVAVTSRLTAAMRERESGREDRLFADPLAAVLAGDEGREVMARLGMRDNPTIPVRTRYVDETLAGILGPEQVVLVAAGMDTRAYRLDLPTVYELDRPELLALKDHLLAGAPARAERRPVGVDLTADWAPALTAAGFDPDRPAVWIVEGVLQYLDEADVHGLLDRVSALAAPGSHLITDTVGRSLLDFPALRPMLEALAANGMRWVFGTDEPEALLTPRGWAPEITRISAYGGALKRWPYPPAAEGYLVHAVR